MRDTATTTSGRLKMKHWKTTDTGPQSIEHGTGSKTSEAARETLKRMNGGLPPNLHMANRGILLRVIKELNDELLRLRATSSSYVKGLPCRKGDAA